MVHFWLPLVIIWAVSGAGCRRYDLLVVENLMRKRFTAKRPAGLQDTIRPNHQLKNSGDSERANAGESFVGPPFQSLYVSTLHDG